MLPRSVGERDLRLNDTQVVDAESKPSLLSRFRRCFRARRRGCREQVLEVQGSIATHAGVGAEPKQVELVERQVALEDGQETRVDVEAVPRKKRGTVGIIHPQAVDGHGEGERIHPNLRDRDVSVQRRGEPLLELPMHDPGQENEAHRGVDEEENR